MGIFGISKGKNYFAPEFPGSVNRGMQTIAKGAEKFELPPPPTLKISEFPKMSIKKYRNLQKSEKKYSTDFGLLDLC